VLIAEGDEHACADQRQFAVGERVTEQGVQRARHGNKGNVTGWVLTHAGKFSGKLTETLTTHCYVSGNGVYAQNLWISLWVTPKITLLSLV
jgi:hypothetical protein